MIVVEPTLSAMTLFAVVLPAVAVIVVLGIDGVLGIADRAYYGTERRSTARSTGERGPRARPVQVPAVRSADGGIPGPGWDVQ